MSDQGLSRLVYIYSMIHKLMVSAFVVIQLKMCLKLSIYLSTLRTFLLGVSRRSLSLGSGQSVRKNEEAGLLFRNLMSSYHNMDISKIPAFLNYGTLITLLKVPQPQPRRIVEDS